MDVINLAARRSELENEVADNGAVIGFDAEFTKYAVHDAGGHLHGYRRDLEAARELASRIKRPKEERWN